MIDMKRVEANMGKSVEKLLAEHPVLSFDKKLALEICGTLQIPVDVASFSSGTRLRTFLLALPNGTRTEFLATYVEMYEEKKLTELIERTNRPFATI